MEIKPVALFRSPLEEKFGLPRQAGLAESLRGTVVLEPAYRSPDALRGLEEFDYLWLVWGFHLNRETASDSLTSSGFHSWPSTKPLRAPGWQSAYVT